MFSEIQKSLFIVTVGLINGLDLSDQNRMSLIFSWSKIGLQIWIVSSRFFSGVDLVYWYFCSSFRWCREFCGWNPKSVRIKLWIIKILPAQPVVHDLTRGDPTLIQTESNWSNLDQFVGLTQPMETGSTRAITTKLNRPTWSEFWLDPVAARPEHDVSKAGADVIIWYLRKKKKKKEACDPTRRAHRGA